MFVLFFIVMHDFPRKFGKWTNIFSWLLSNVLWSLPETNIHCILILFLLPTSFVSTGLNRIIMRVRLVCLTKMQLMCRSHTKHIHSCEHTECLNEKSFLCLWVYWVYGASPIHLKINQHSVSDVIKTMLLPLLPINFLGTSFRRVDPGTQSKFFSLPLSEDKPINHGLSRQVC